MKLATLPFLLWSCTSVYASPLSLRTSLQTRAWTDQTWDVIVVGAGPAGIIIADKLSEAGKKVLLLEQGGPSYAITGGTERPDWLAGTNLSRVDVPGLYSSIYSNASAALLCGSKLSAYGACTVAGDSAINAGLYFQPPASDWDTFFPTGWKSSNVNAATQRILARQPPVTTTSQDGKYYLQSSYNAARNWIVNITGYSEVSFDVTPNTRYRAFGRAVYDYINATRGGPVRTYLQTSRTRSNFLLQTGVQVRRVVRNGSNATGVYATINGGTNVTISLATGGRVILSGGALFSPQLLMLSAIGDPTTLTKISKAGGLGGVPSSQWINNTNVGLGLFDNPNTFIGLQSSAITAYNYSYNSPVPADRDLYLKSASGPYSFAGGTNTFWTYINHTDGTPPTGVQAGVGTGGYGSWASNPNAVTMNIYGTSGMLSSGSVTISTKTFAPGVSGSTYYSNPRDASDIAQFIYDIFQTLPQAGISPINIPQNSTKAQIQTYITTYSTYARGQVNHFSSSCRIGACVDANTRVIGMNNLHVVDGSIVAPFTVNPQFGIMIAAERASELILSL